MTLRPCSSVVTTLRAASEALGGTCQAARDIKRLAYLYIEGGACRVVDLSPAVVPVYLDALDLAHEALVHTNELELARVVAYLTNDDPILRLLGHRMVAVDVAYFEHAGWSPA